MEKQMTLAEIVAEVQKSLPEQLKGMVAESMKLQLAESLKPIENKILDLSTIAQPKIAEEKCEKIVQYIKAMVNHDYQTMKAIIGKELTEGTTTAGGYLTPDEWAFEINRVTSDYGVFRRNAMIVPMSSDVKYVPKAGTTGVTATWTTESTAKTETTPNFDIITLTAVKLAAITAYTDELFEDSAVNIIQYLNTLFAEQFAYKEDLAGFYGDGTSTYGSITGISAATGVNSVTLTGGLSTISASKILDMIASLGSSGLKNAKFFMNNKVFVSKVWGLMDDNHTPIVFKPADKPVNYIYGYPVETCDSLPYTDAASTPFIWFGDLKNAMLGNRKGMTAKILSEATLTTAGNLAEQDLSALRVVERLGITIAQPSQFAVLKTSA